MRYRSSLKSIRNVDLFNKLWAVFPLLIVLTLPAQAHIALLTPVGGETFIAHQVVHVTWDVFVPHGPGTITLEYSTDGGLNYNLITNSLTFSGNYPADRYGSYDWVVPEDASNNCILRAYYNMGGGYYGQNASPFAIQVIPTVEVILEQGINSYSGTQDNTIYSESANTNGGGQYVLSGMTNTGNSRRALLAFDISSIPSGSTIIAASLQLTVVQTSSATSTQHLHRLTADWGEGTQAGSGSESTGTLPANGDATWLSNFHNVSAWSVAGGDFSLIPSATAEVVGIGSTPTWLSAGLALDVQNWLDGTLPNYGWVLIGDESINQTAKRFNSSENTTALAGQRPRLVVRYATSPSTDVGQKRWSLYR